MEKIEIENKSEVEERQISPSITEEKIDQTDGRLKRPFPILLIALVAAVALDLLFFEKMWGWHWAVGVNLYLAAVVVSARLEGKKLPRTSITLIVLTSLTALLTGFRSASATTTALVFVSGLGMLLVTVSLLNGQWMQFRLRELIGELFKLIPSGVIGTPLLMLEGIQLSQESKEQNPEKSKHGLAILRGVLITIPLLLVFGLLLAAADTIFSNQLGSAFDWLKFDIFDNFIPHTLIILLLTWFGAAALWHALTKSEKPLVLQPDKPLFKPFLGMTETSIALISLNVLFAFFLVVQFRYFFAGSANVSIDGFTYAEYARRGFFELVAVALIASVLYFGLASFTKRDTEAKKRAFSAMAGLLLVQVGVMLISAFQRLRLYEQAYGFTSPRLAAHVFMIFVGLLLLALIIMELTNTFRKLGLVLMLGFLAFALVMVGLNEDALIAKQNLERAVQGEKLDATYLVHGLTNDAVPTLFRYMADTELNPELQEKLQLVMACRYGNYKEVFGNTPWQSTSISELVAGKLFDQHAEVLSNVPLRPKTTGASVTIDGEIIWCYGQLDW
jgi:ABC-type multidrug transport system fused ATPase/permease subunit